MKKLMLIVFFLNSFFVSSQTKKDSILTILKIETIDSRVSLINKVEKTKTVVYKLCEHWADKVNYLKLNLTDLEIKELKNDTNASLNIIGLICELEKNNTKENAIGQINNLINSEKKFISLGCSDAITTYSLANYFLYLITEKNKFFKPNFKLKKAEIKDIKNRILIAENNL